MVTGSETATFIHHEHLCQHGINSHNLPAVPSQNQCVMPVCQQCRLEKTPLSVLKLADNSHLTITVSEKKNNALEITFNWDDCGCHEDDTDDEK